MEAMEAPSIDEVRESTTSKEILVRTSRRSGDGGHSCLHHRGGATCFRKVKMHNNEEMRNLTYTHERQRELEKTKIMVRLYAFTKKCMSCDTRAHYY